MRIHSLRQERAPPASMERPVKCFTHSTVPFESPAAAVFPVPLQSLACWSDVVGDNAFFAKYGPRRSSTGVMISATRGQPPSHPHLSLKQQKMSTSGAPQTQGPHNMFKVSTFDRQLALSYMLKRRAISSAGRKSPVQIIDAQGFVMLIVQW